jgi:hypothetical protein
MKKISELKTKDMGAVIGAVAISVIEQPLILMTTTVHSSRKPWLGLMPAVTTVAIG